MSAIEASGTLSSLTYPPHDDASSAVSTSPPPHPSPSARQALAAATAPMLRPVYSDPQVRIVSDESISLAKAKELADRIEQAYAFDEKQERWKDLAPLATPFTVSVLSRQQFGQLTGDPTGSTAGVTTGPNDFVVPDTVLGQRSAMDENVIAHELSHIQDEREAGPSSANIPIYLQEGKAYVLGEQYPLSEHLRNPHLEYVASYLQGVNADEARTVLAGFRRPADESNPELGFPGETLGALFVEFLRTRLSGAGKADAVPRLAQATREVGTGSSFDQAFQKGFGVSLAQAEDQFVAYIQSTEGNPAARFQGTIFQLARTS